MAPQSAPRLRGGLSPCKAASTATPDKTERNRAKTHAHSRCYGVLDRATELAVCKTSASRQSRLFWVAEPASALARCTLHSHAAHCTAASMLANPVQQCCRLRTLQHCSSPSWSALSKTLLSAAAAPTSSTQCNTRRSGHHFRTTPWCYIVSAMGGVPPTRLARARDKKRGVRNGPNRQHGRRAAELVQHHTMIRRRWHGPGRVARHPQRFDERTWSRCSSTSTRQPHRRVRDISRG